MRSTFQRRRRVLAAAAATLAVAGGIAYAAIPDADGTYHGCVQHARGALRVIDPATERCNANTETAITFAAQGAAGPPGPPGPAGPPGPPGADGEDGTFSGTFTSPNGQYSLSVTDSGIVLASPDSSINLSAGAIEIQTLGADGIVVRGGNDVRVEGAAGLDLRAGANLTARAGGSGWFESGGITTIRGANVVVNPSGTCASAAREGDSVSTTSNRIVTGSPTVCIGN